MKSNKPKRRLQVKPLKGHFFDIKPSKKPELPHQKKNAHRPFFTIALLVLFLFIGFRLWFGIKDLYEESRQAAFQGIEELQQAVEAAQGQNLTDATQAFKSAQVAFEALSQNLGGSNAFDASTQSTGTLGNIQALAQWSVQVSQLGADLTTWAQKHTQEIPSFELVFAGDVSALLDQVQQAQEDFDPLLQKASELDEVLHNINLSFLKDQLSQAKDQFGILMGLLEKGHFAFEGLNLLLGVDEPHTYLILFQNSNEIRATGGFIGSVAAITVENGVMGEIEPYDIYNIDRHLEELIPAPPGIAEISGGRFYSRDANYWPDFPTSAEKILELMEKSGYAGFDTVVAIDQTVAETLLKYIPPLSTEDGVFEINAETFTPLLQFYTEAKLSESINPKAFLFSLIPQVKEQLNTIEDKELLMEELLDLTEKGHAQFYSTYPQAQLIFDELDVSGRLLEPKENQDFLSVISTSIGGNKSDVYMNTAIEHLTQIDSEGKITDELTIKKRHTWNEESWNEFAPYVEHYGTGKTEPDLMRFILGDGGNLDYMRVYVPKGSSLIDTQGIGVDEIDVFEEGGYTVFGFEFGPVEPGSLNEVELTYRLPFQLEEGRSSYTFAAEPQAIRKNTFLKKNVEVGEGWQVLGGQSSLSSLVDQVPVFDALFERDEFYRVDLVHI